MTYGNDHTALGDADHRLLCTGYEDYRSGSASCSAMTELQSGAIVNVKATQGSALHQVTELKYQNQNALVGFLYRAL